MTMAHSLRPALVACLLACVLPAAAQAPVIHDIAPVSGSSLVESGRELEPFVARYQVIADGRNLGEATLQLVQLAPRRWRVDLDMSGRGLFRLAGIHAEQSTVFEDTAGGFLPLSQGTVRRHLFNNKRITGTYDWSNRQAVWEGDVKEGREAPVALQPGDLSGLLINLAVIRDAEPGRELQYRYVDNGRAKPHAYAVAAETESVAVGELSYDAMRVTRQPDPGDDEQTVIWVARGVPTPIRMLKREDGVDSYDLRLVDYTGAQ